MQCCAKVKDKGVQSSPETVAKEVQTVLNNVDKDFLQMEVDNTDGDSSTTGSSIYTEAYRSKQSSFASMDTTFEGKNVQLIK